MQEINQAYAKRLDNPIIVSLDSAGENGAIEIMKELDKKVWGFKLGALLYRTGPSFFERIRQEVGSVNLLLELQFTGTPDFIVQAINASSLYACDLSYIVVNSSAGPPGIKAAVDNTRLSRILVGSVLDSLSIYDIKYMYGTDVPEEVTLRFAKMAKYEGANGIYCSSRDLEMLSHYPELKSLTKIVYGVRPRWDPDHGTHKFVMTPKEVIARGATKFVIGSTIRNAPNKLRVVKKILKEINR